MYALYKELHPPTSVDHCVSCKFTSETDANVITASGHVLRVYKVRKVRFILFVLQTRNGTVDILAFRAISPEVLKVDRNPPSPHCTLQLSCFSQ